MRYPEFLKENGTIGFVAPSFGCATEPYISRLDSALNKLQELGYKTVLGPNCRIAEGIGISNAPEKCGEELNSFYKSDENDALISVGGGELMCEVVPYMDFELVRNSKPKWYMGYSDNTNFIFLSVTIADTAAIYAPCAGDMGMKPWHKSVQDAYDLLTGKKLKFENYDLWELEQHGEGFEANEPYNMTEKNVMKAFIPSGGSLKEAALSDKISIEGRLIGGCLDCLANLVGTPYDKVKEFSDRYKDDGIIWFLEACDLNVFSIRRTLWNLKEAGWFTNLKGFLIGRPGCFGQDIMGLNQYNAVTDILGEYKVPILMDLDIGHHPPMLPIICGSIANVNYADNHFEIEYILR
ncbi:MAG: LD-carboxypeptidase [Butyrivibrio sp.]|nr:LD-carboxypeptidase [Butyrivibrio sp.]